MVDPAQQRAAAGEASAGDRKQEEVAVSQLMPVLVQTGAERRNHTGGPLVAEHLDVVPVLIRFNAQSKRQRLDHPQVGLVTHEPAQLLEPLDGADQCVTGPHAASPVARDRDV